MSVPDWTVAGVPFHSLRRVGRFASFLRSIRATNFLLFELNWGFHATRPDTPVATIGTTPWGDVRAERRLGVGYPGRLGPKRTLGFRS
jgi:hypothetical protein